MNVSLIIHSSLEADSIIGHRVYFNTIKIAFKSRNDLQYTGCPKKTKTIEITYCYRI
jgi:hypothetical protein